MTTKRFPRKAKKWAKKNKVRLAFVEGKRMWYYCDAYFMMKCNRM